jgi:enamine deaminase RidA (YjgF/YER057c/UK114 family)
VNSTKRRGEKIMTFEFILKGNRRRAIAAMAMTVLLGAALVSSKASAQNTKRIPLPASQNPSNSDLPIAGAVWAGDTLYVSGWLDPDLKTHTDTESQTVGIIKDIQKLLESQKLTLGDVVMMRVYLGGDPAKGGKADYRGMMAGYSQFFGTKEQPNKPARTTVQVVLPAGERGALVEIDLIAVHPTSGRLL